MEKQCLAVSHQGSLSYVALCEAEASMKHNLHHTQAYQEDLMWQVAAAEDQPALTEVMWEEEQELNKIIEEEQAQKAQISVLSQKQLHAMERVEEQEQELRWISVILQMQRGNS